MARKRPSARAKLFDLRLDPVALAALVLSLIAAVASLWAWWHGPSVRLLAPDRVALYSQIAPDGAVAIRIAAHMSYANVAQAPYGDLVLVERAKLTVGELETRQRWNAFGEITERGVTRIQDAAPQPLPGQSATSHFTLFTPVPRVCPDDSADCEPMQDYVDPQELAEALQTATRLQFQFQIELFDGSALGASCHVPLSTIVREKLADVVTVPFYATCHQESRG